MRWGLDRHIKWTALGSGARSRWLQLQFVPYGRDHSNPAGGRRIAWDSPAHGTADDRRVHGLSQQLSPSGRGTRTSHRSRGWCRRTSQDGREASILSTDGEVEVDEMIETIREGSMPPWQYKPTHPEAWLSGQEKQDLIRGLEETFGGGGAEAKRERERERREMRRGNRFSSMGSNARSSWDKSSCVRVHDAM